jgi:hypothetical protein
LDPDFEAENAAFYKIEEYHLLFFMNVVHFYFKKLNALPKRIKKYSNILAFLKNFREIGTIGALSVFLIQIRIQQLKLIRMCNLEHNYTFGTEQKAVC